MEQQILKRNVIYEYWLGNIPGIGRKTIVEMLNRWENAETVFFLKESELAQILTDQQRYQFKNSKRQWNLYSEYELLERKGIRFISMFHNEYPKRLLEIPDAPYALYVLGKLPPEDAKIVAMIGARRCSEYGRKVAEEYAEVLVHSGIQVVSGMARGIDGISQNAILKNGGVTYAVLGCGCDVCYPAESMDLYKKIAASGGVLSEYPPGTQPKPNLFPPRNRIISGLSDALLVIEAKEKSGTLITVDMALEQGREIYAVPGRITDVLSSGCNRLIRQGAGIALSPEEMIKEVFGEIGHHYKSDKTKDLRHVNMSREEQLLFEELDYSPISLELLCGKCESKKLGMDAQTIMMNLLYLQLKGMVGKEGSHYYKTGEI